MIICEATDKACRELLNGKKDFYELKDFSISSKTAPGQWLVVNDKKGNYMGVVMANPYTQNGPKIRLISSFKFNDSFSEDEIVLSLIEKALIRRKNQKVDISNCRLVFGDNDSLPGLVIDKYENLIIVQINSAGIDKFRNSIKEFLKDKFSTNVYLLDNKKYREDEGLPEYKDEKNNLPEKVDIFENGIKYQIPMELIQKVGHYYDHRDNRKKMELFFRDFDKTSQMKGLDLFCYVGAWGLHLLQSGVRNVDFVDQGNFQGVIKNNILINKLDNSGEYYREDVFKFLKRKIEKSDQYDVIISDPPAFCKSSKQKRSALNGYSKLHRMCLQLVKRGGFFIAASCTKYVSFEELSDNVNQEALKLGIELTLLDIGIQGADHRVSSIKDKGCYIKYFLYSVS